MVKRIGKYTLQMENGPVIMGFGSIGGRKEGEGPLGKYFDQCYEDTTLGESSWEKSESRLQTEAVEVALHKAKCSASEINYIFAGDLLNQCIASTFGLRGLGIPFLGQYGACSTMAQSPGARGGFSLTAGSGRTRRRRDLLSFLLRRAAVPPAAGIRRPARPHRTVDGDGLPAR